MYGRPLCRIRRSGRKKRSFDAQGSSRMASSFLPASAVRFPQRFAGQKKNRGRESLPPVAALRRRTSAPAGRTFAGNFTSRFHAALFPCRRPPHFGMKVSVSRPVAETGMSLQSFPLIVYAFPYLPVSLRSGSVRCCTSRTRRPLPPPALRGGATGAAPACRVRDLGPGIGRSREQRQQGCIRRPSKPPSGGFSDAPATLPCGAVPPDALPAVARRNIPHSRRSQGIRDSRHLRCRQPAPSRSPGRCGVLSPPVKY